MKKQAKWDADAVRKDRREHWINKIEKEEEAKLMATWKRLSGVKHADPVKPINGVQQDEIDADAYLKAIGHHAKRVYKSTNKATGDCGTLSQKNDGLRGMYTPSALEFQRRLAVAMSYVPSYVTAVDIGSDKSNWKGKLTHGV